MPEPLLWTILTVQCTSPDRRLMGMRSITPGNKDHFLGTPIYKGLGEICARQTCLFEGQSAAHGQITERNFSVARFRFSLATAPSVPALQTRHHLLH